MKNLFLFVILVVNSYAFQIDDKHLLESYIRNSIDNGQSFTDHKCGTRYDLAIESQRDKIDPGLYEKYSQIRSSDPVRQRSLVTDSGYFALHWDDTGGHAVPQEDVSGNGIPDYIDSAAVILDYVRDVQVNQLGYLPPPGLDGNPAVPYQIYFTNQFAYGITRQGDLITANLPDTSYTSYIEMDNDFAEYYFPTKGIDALKVTAAHEFHHAVQLGYSFRRDDVYFFEMTSTWMEEYIYPEIDDYLNYLDYFFEVVSDTRFDSVNLTYPYANSIYLQMLEANHDASIITSIWNKMKTEKSLPAIVSTLDEYSSSWYESMTDYGLWLYYTGSRAISGSFYEDASLFPEITIKIEDKIEFEAAYVEDVNITEIGNRYLEFQNVRGKILDVQVISASDLENGFRMMTSQGYSLAYQMNNKIMTEPIDADQLVIVMTNAKKASIVATTDISESGSIDLTTVFPFPNPVNTKDYGSVRFQNVPPEAELHVFNTSGKRVARVENQGSSRTRSWYLKNDDGEEVAGGVYFYLVQGDGLLKRGKFSIIR